MFKILGLMKTLFTNIDSVNDVIGEVMLFKIAVNIIQQSNL